MEARPDVRFGFQGACNGCEEEGRESGAEGGKDRQEGEEEISLGPLPHGGPFESQDAVASLVAAAFFVSGVRTIEINTSVRVWASACCASESEASQMTNEQALKLADTPDWWMGPDRRQDRMRTLRAALALALPFGERAFLFRPGGFGTPALWLSAADVARLGQALASAQAA